MNETFKTVFEDEHIIVLEKIAKILILPSPKKERYTLTSLLSAHFKQAVFPCHRLDRETTGLIIYAKSRQMQERVMDEFRQGLVKKKYLAFVRGKLKQKSGMLSGFILDTEGRRFGEKPKKAKTFYRVANELKDFSVVELEPLTGRTNQLRIQLAKIGHPILGERKYAFGRDFNVRFRRLALHASFISFIHPVNCQRLEFRLDLAPDMKVFLSQRG